MKKYLLFFVLLTFIVSTKSYSQVQVTTEGFVQVDYNGDQSLTFGENAGSSYPSRGQWAIEYWNGGLNFWRPWPNSYSASYRLFIQNNGYVGINDGTPSYQLDVNGDIASRGIKISSDERFKTDIKPLIGALANLKKLEGVSYKMKKYKDKYSGDDINSLKDDVKLKTFQSELAAKNDNPEADKYGFIAQEVRKIYPELVDEDNEGYLNLDYIGFIPILVEAIKEQQAEIDALRKQLEK